MKLNFNLDSIIVEVNTPLKGNKLTKEVLEEMITNFESLPMTEKVKLIKNVSIVNEEADLTLQNVKLGQMVETINDGKLGMIIKINKKNILVKLSNGIVSGPPTAFKSTRKKAETLIKGITQNSFEKEFEGTFLELFVNNEWQPAITISNLNASGKIKALLYKSSKTVDLTKMHLTNDKYVKLVNEKELKFNVVKD